MHSVAYKVIYKGKIKVNIINNISIDIKKLKEKTASQKKIILDNSH